MIFRINRKKITKARKEVEDEQGENTDSAAHFLWQAQSYTMLALKQDLEQGNKP